MNEQITNEISKDLNIENNQTIATLEMLQEGNTIPFIARYRKEKTGNLTEEQIKASADVYEYQVNLLKRKEDVIRLIDEKGLLTEELKTQILNCSKLVEVEDLYRPYKEKKKTKATEAIKNGLEPMAKMILSCPLTGDNNQIASKFINDAVKNTQDALEGAKYIIAEWISDNAAFRKYIRNNMYKFWKEKGTKVIFTANNNWGVTNAHDAVIYMEELYRFYLENEEYGQELMKNFLNANPKFIKGKNKYKVANKSGWSGTAIHDVSIIFADNPYIVVALSNLGYTDYYMSYFNKANDLAYKLHTEYWKYKMDMCGDINQY
jgi:transcriptional accessory protein Tex/SPT6